MDEIKKTPWHSYLKGNLPEGCLYCVKGQKMVIFITGICNRRCFYCPVSEEKIYQDCSYANEWNLNLTDKDLNEEQYQILIDEAKLTEAKGAGITGGDPLLVIKRTEQVVKRLKKEFGPKFHIHAYTSLNNVSEDRLKILFEAGLDEIRFHPELEDQRFWSRIEIVNKFKWKKGIEIPVIPGYKDKTKVVISYFADKVDFINLNELEISDSSHNQLLQQGFNPKDRQSYAVSGSEELAMEIMEYSKDRYPIPIHFCTSKLKNGVQLANRIKIRSKNIAYRFDKIDKEGILIRGGIYFKELFPSFSYREKIRKITEEDRKIMINKLKELKNKIVPEFRIREDDLQIDDYKLRLITSDKWLRKNANRLKKLNLFCAVVHEYPTKDGIELEVSPL